MFKVTIALKDVGEYDNFPAAWKRMFGDIFAALHNQGMSYQVLDTMCYITRDNSGPVSFYDARDLAYRCGLMDMETAGLVEDPAPLTDGHYTDINHTFQQATEDAAHEFVEILEKISDLDMEILTGG